MSTSKAPRSRTVSCTWISCARFPRRRSRARSASPTAMPRRSTPRRLDAGLMPDDRLKYRKQGAPRNFRGAFVLAGRIVNSEERLLAIRYSPSPQSSGVTGGIEAPPFGGASAGGADGTAAGAGFGAAAAGDGDVFCGAAFGASAGIELVASAT